MMQWASSSPLKALRGKTQVLEEEGTRPPDCFETQDINLLLDLPACPLDFGFVSPYNHVN